MRLRDSLIASSFSLALAAFAFGDVTGKITLSGKAPQPHDIDMSSVKECAALHADPVQDDTVVIDSKGDLANVLISIKTDDPAALGGEVPKTPAVLDQKGCMYSPHVLPMMVGQEFLVKNSDGFLHNVQSLAQTNPAFNKAQPNKNTGEKMDPQKAVETFKAKCQVHPWMAAWIIVLDHPFFSVSKADGAFSIKGLPDGDYTIQAWHEKYGTMEKKISVKGGNATVDFAFDASKAEGDSPVKTIMASASGEAVVCDSCCAPSAAAAMTAAAPATQPTALAK